MIDGKLSQDILVAIVVLAAIGLGFLAAVYGIIIGVKRIIRWLQ